MQKKIPIEELKIGMIFSMPLYTKDNNSLIPAGVPLKEADYNRLVRWGVKELLTDGELIGEEKNIEKKAEKIIESTPEYIRLYNECLFLFADFVDFYIKKDSFKKDKLEQILKIIFDLINEYKNDIISHMAVEKEDYDFLIIHSINSTIIALIGAEQLSIDKKDINHLGMAGLLHDVGMLKVPDNILNKTEKLDQEEYNIIKSHPIVAYKQMSKIGIFNQVVLDAVLQHQEQFDGNGYPRKLKGDNIGLFAKILAVADTFEAQISPRAYRKATTGYLAMKSVLAEAQNKFDPKILRAFLTTLSIYPPGTVLQLNDNSIGIVISVNPDAPLRPNIRIIIDRFGEKISDDNLKDLRQETELFIIRVLNKEEYEK